MSEVTIKFNGQMVEAPQGASVLDALLGAGLDIPHNCRKGTCLSCSMVLVDGEVSPAAQKGLRQSQIRQGRFLSCCQLADKNIEVALPDGVMLNAEAVVVEKRMLNPLICALKLEPRVPFAYRAGQFINIRHKEGIGRSYSLASVEGRDEYLELHIKWVQDGLVSSYVHNELKTGDSVQIQGPFGDCFYIEGKQNQPILLIGTSTGLAPLIGIVRDALKKQHKGPMYLYHGAIETGGLYLHDSLGDLAQVHENFHYIGCVLGEGEAGIRAQRVDEAALQDHPNLTGWRVFLCGNPEMVNLVKKQAYLAGAELSDIYSDPFVPSASSARLASAVA